jgi:predicted enzyme related to lactoylglutathione lyase
MKLQNVYCVVRDMDRAERFYRDVFGAAPKFRDGDRWTQFSAGGASVSLSSAEEAAAGLAGFAPVFEVDDIAAHGDKIAAAGGTVLDRRDMGDHGRTLTFVDSEGNVAQLFQRAKTD